MRRGRPTTRPFSWQEAVDFLAGRGIADDAMLLGSMPEASVRFMADTIRPHCPRRPLRAVHVGNFVGVSLAGLTDALVRHDPASVVISVDPNLRHLGVEDPQRHVLALLDHFGLQANSIVTSGYSLHRVANETPVGTFADEAAGEETLDCLGRLGQRFDVALLDGNHDAGYVRREVGLLVRLLAPDALLVLDDVRNENTRLPELYDELVADRAWPLEEIAQDGRVGILRRTRLPRRGRGRFRRRTSRG